MYVGDDESESGEGIGTSYPPPEEVATKMYTVSGFVAQIHRGTKSLYMYEKLQMSVRNREPFVLAPDRGLRLR
jgi:hypothetical protein